MEGWHDVRVDVDIDVDVDVVRLVDASERDRAGSRGRKVILDLNL